MNTLSLVPAWRSSRLMQKAITNLWALMAGDELFINNMLSMLSLLPVNRGQISALSSSSPTARPSNTAWKERARTNENGKFVYVSHI